MKLYSVRDLKLGKYGIPFIMDNDMTATRSFLLSLADVTHPSPMTAFPTDFELYQVGEFDFATGKVTPLPECTRFVASVGSYPEQFEAMLKKFIELKNSTENNNLIAKVKSNLIAFKDSYLNAMSAQFDYDEEVYNTLSSSFKDLLINSSLLTREEIDDE